MTFKEVGQSDVRAVVYDSAVKQIAKYAYKFKQLVSTTSSGAWNAFFFREQLTIPTGATGNLNKGIPRGADFPQASLSWEKVQSTIDKYGLEDTISYEDIISDNIDVRDRTLMRIAESVAKSVDSEIANVLSEGWVATNIQSQALTGGKWTESSAAIVKDISSAKKKIRDYYENADNFVLVINGNDEVNMTSYLYEKGAQAPTIGADMALNGNVGKVAGVDIVVSNIVPASYALLVVPDKCGTWKSLLELSTNTETKKFKGDTITACEMGVTELHNPKQVVLLNTA